ncbi:glucose-6-phosphate/phosphate translocator 2 [Carex littledalei]|uniref:Glucose-6-phosphate/phosphate translocator 2 n=1 Tax=Carex littledalei TaxID=544730 RepID=A0A833QE38_9POAL|nr:glucose-6-phosphate/phosphate translocator 2 [Carex littledalei]
MHNRLRSTEVRADGDRPSDLPPVVPIDSEKKQTIKISIYFATWWALNVVFNIYNKKVLNAFPFPWLTSVLSLAAGSLIMLVSWATHIAEAPKTDMDFWKALAPVAIAHTIGHVAATVSMSKVAVSFTHIIKSLSPCSFHVFSWARNFLYRRTSLSCPSLVAVLWLLRQS